MKKMMKMFALVMLFVMMVATAYAASECSLCGRTHELTADGKCPEACTVVHHGNEHHYYECSEPVVCGVCGQTDHNTNTCPSYDASWIDSTGGWKKDKYLNGQEARKPIWCGLCDHYGYHYEWECKKAPQSTPTPEATNTPCKHMYVESYRSEERDTSTRSEKICYVKKGTIKWSCEYCGAPYKDTAHTKQTMEHEFHNYVCKECGYDITPVTPEPTATPTSQPTATPIPTVTPCSHANYRWEYVKNGEYWMCDDTYCLTTYYHKVCNYCANVVDDSLKPENVTHNYNAQMICAACGYVHSAHRATPQPTFTPVPTSAPCEHELDVRLVHSEYGDPLMKDDLVCAQGKVVYHVNCNLCGEFIRQYEVADSKEHNYNAGYICTDCGYVHSAHRATPTPMVTPLPTSTPCTHVNKVNEYVRTEISATYPNESGKCRDEQPIYQTVCKDCGETWPEYAASSQLKTEHVYNENSCVFCGTLKIDAVVVPVATETPSAVPTNPLEVVEGLAWWQWAMIIVAIILVVVLVAGKFI